MRNLPICLCLAAGLLVAANAAAKPPQVVVTIKPIHSLVAAVMAGVGEPKLLITGAADEHSYALRPSDAHDLAAADIVFWVGPLLETFMPQPLATLASGARSVRLMDAQGLNLLPARQGGAWEAHDQGTGDAGAPPQGRTAAPQVNPGVVYNAHIWLDPDNAKVLVQVIAAALAEADPQDAAIYRANAAATLQRLEKLDAALAEELGDLRQRPFIVFHDAYPYFENRYGLSAVGSVTLRPEIQPGARRLRELRAKILALGAVCVFGEPQFEPRLVQTLINGTAARTGTLDAIGAALQPGPDLYFALLQSLADHLRACLGNA